MQNEPLLENDPLALPTAPAGLDADRLSAFENPGSRLPILLCLDVSGSMAGEPLTQLQAGLDQFFTELAQNEACRYSVEPAVITFADDARLVLPFTPLNELRREHLPTLAAGGSTSLGAALDLAWREIQRRRADYRRAGIPCYRPLLLALTDGGATDGVEAAAARFQSAENENRIALLPIGVGPKADMQMLARIAQRARPPKRLQGLVFTSLFRWVVDSLRVIGGSTSDRQIILPPTDTWSLMP